MPVNYNETLNLPTTPFSMRAGLTTKEPEMLKDWAENSLYEKLIQNNEGKPVYILHDGPPYANASIHMGTAMNKVLKDMIVRYKNMAGFKAPYVPGWDTHGLPTERKALEELGEEGRRTVTPYDLRRLCHEYAMKYVGVQREQFLRLGVIGDYFDPYLTLTPGFEEKQIEVFGEMAQKGYIYRGLKPVYWCPADRTALAEAEIEYQDDPCNTVYVAFSVAEDNGALAKAGIPADKTSFVIWTTTTWTLPGNVAICLGPDIDYVAAKAGEKYYIVARELLTSTMEACNIEDHEVTAEFKGAELERIWTQHCYLDRKSLVIVGGHVTTESGTGCVHTAPGHGVEDFDVCKNYPELPVIVPVDDDGILTEEAGRFAGLSVFKAGPVIEKALAENGTLVGEKHIVHPYAHCWRCHHPVIFRATEQWFCSVEDFRNDTYKAIENVEWIPAWGKERMTAMVRDRNDWCISRQRLWGVPIPAFHCDDCGEYLLSAESIAAVQKLFAKEGSDAWYTHTAEEILPPGTVCPKCGGSHWSKETDTMDVWFDSGSSHASVLTQRQDHTWPADLYIEGSDQFRGWFQSSLLTGVATRGTAPYKSVISCGWVMDGEGRKMSKSAGNGIAPEEIIKDYGADIIRLWVAASDYQVDVRLSKDILKQLSEAYRKIRNTARFMLANISDFDPAKDSVPHDQLQDLDRWALAEFDKLAATAKAGYDNFDFHKVYHNLSRFCVVEMSNFYLDIIKDRLYINPANSQPRRAAQTVMFTILSGIARILSPILCFTTQEIWDHMPAFTGKHKYVAMQEMPQPGQYTLPGAEADKWQRIIAITADVKKVLEAARAEKKIGSSLEAAVVLHCDEALYAFCKELEAQWADIFIVSQVEAVQGGEGATGEVEGLQVEFKPAAGQKCERCWQYKTTVGEDAAHPTLCARCAGIIKEMGL